MGQDNKVRKINLSKWIVNIFPILLLCTCVNVDYRSMNIHYSSKSENRSSKTKKILLVQKIHGNEFLKENYTNFVRGTLKALEDTQMFDSVYYKNLPPLSSENDQVFQSEIYYNWIDDYQFDWIFSWPAVYPMPGYFPLQIRKGKAKVTVDIILKSGEDKKKKFIIEKQKDYKIYFYGFFRTGPVREILENLTTENMKAWRRISEFDFEDKAVEYYFY